MIYFDSASFNSFMYKRKTWSYADHIVEVPINQFRYSQTVIGAIGTCIKDNYCLTFGDSSTAEAVLDHLKELKKSLRNPKSKPWLVLDNA